VTENNRMDGESERIRVVVMGDNKVGKTAILQRFLHNTFKPQYKPTVEDLYSKDFQIGESTLKVDFLDTAGDDQFPVMRRLSISSGNAFLLVYSITCPSSLQIVHTRLEEIKSQRNDFKDVPIVIVGNKTDLADASREIFLEDVRDWLDQDFKHSRIEVLECSAYDSYNIVSLFKSFLALSKIDFLLVGNERHQEDEKLQRGKSAYARIKQLSFKKRTSEIDIDEKQNFNDISTPKSKQRSRSLIRRSSKKVKQKINEVDGIENCVIN